MPFTYQMVEANSNPTGMTPLWLSKYSLVAQQFLRTWTRLSSRSRSTRVTSRSTISSLAATLALQIPSSLFPLLHSHSLYIFTHLLVLSLAFSSLVHFHTSPWPISCIFATVQLHAFLPFQACLFQNPKKSSSSSSINHALPSAR